MDKFTINTGDTMVLFVDIQGKMLPAMADADAVKRNSYVLLKAAELLGLPCLITEQYPKGLGPTIPELAGPLEKMGAAYSDKTAFNALTPTIKEALAQAPFAGRKNVVVCGIETHICVFQSVRTLLGLGYNVFIPVDAVSSREVRNKESALSMFMQMGAVVSCTESLLFDLMEDSKNPHFKELQALIK